MIPCSPIRRRLGVIFVLMVIGLTGYCLMALPFRATGAAARVAPVAGYVVAAPFDVTAAGIDQHPAGSP